MNSLDKNLIWTIAVAMAIPLSANAAEGSHRCAEQFDDARRLACYDAEYGRPVIVRTPAAAAGPAVVAAPVVETRPPASQTKAAKKTTAATSSGRFTASIKTLDLLYDGRFRATFDNGEVWTQLEPDKAVVLAAGDTVTVKKAVLGSFQLVTPAGIITRVKQVE